MMMKPEQADRLFYLYDNGTDSGFNDYFKEVQKETGLTYERMCQLLYFREKQNEVFKKEN
ncbi:hypothetical protein COJ60_29070 [Bacillus cereus]|uniref:hypothetical protein n=1 Tax=Bacillus TaxID=1386 RepID=UPI000943AE3A|nr:MULTISPECIES: hypothetical protein [Bacillus cereus group]PFN29919.1 hypothetical protein COJ60_29070 [Bacillus cereus]MDA2164328.1 hypothetical protein [Bacillus cereus group sp. Bc252]MDF9513254.1 hypothetical protein [Bacillus paranthracis]MDF9672256.1 hypothetical protein [Bacillus paranthracis]MDG1611996.1 hypothetical protein [Bacillus paranthracis]